MKKRNQTLYSEMFLETPKNEEESSREYFRRLSSIYGGKPAGFRGAWYRSKLQEAEPPAKFSTVHTPDNEQKKWDENKDSAEWSYSGTRRIETLEDALEFSDVDLSVWCVDRWTHNAWEVTMKDDKGNPIQRTNVQVKVWFKKIEDHDIEWQKIIGELKAYSKQRKKVKIRSAKGSGVGMVLTSDFHLGAYVDDLVRSEKFDISILVSRLEEIAGIINSWGLDEVHVGMLGDFIESFTGLNHRNVWKGLSKGMYGMGSVKLCFEVLLDNFLYRINNLKGVYLVSGNHDRVTSDKNEDTKGEVGDMLSWLLQRELEPKGIEVRFHPMVLGVMVDGIYYVLCHGDKGFSSKEVSKVLFEYGKQGVFNFLAQGHLHTRRATKSRNSHAFKSADIQVVQIDECDYRAITVAPIFTGNFFSEALGYTSTAGFDLICNNGKGKPNVFDFSV